MWLWMSLVASAQQAPELVSTPDPVLEYAQIDVRSTRKAQLGLLLGTVGGPLVVAGGAGITSYFERETRIGEQLSWGMFGVGLTGVIVGTPLLANHSLRSRRALRQQGLKVNPIPGYATWGLYFGSFVVGSVAFDEGSVVGGVVAISMYFSAIGTGAAQLGLNHAARKKAGWLTDLQVTPWTDGTAHGFALVTVR